VLINNARFTGTRERTYDLPLVFSIVAVVVSEVDASKSPSIPISTENEVPILNDEDSKDRWF
jgi:hypothetical protein